MCYDARDLVIGCAIHNCSPSCWKYHSKGASHICRHNFYHVVTFVTEDWEEIRRRRGGKALRGCVGIFRETQYGMAGRILTYQLNSFECPTNYAALVAMRCNVDLQDMRRVLPPRLFLMRYNGSLQGHFNLSCWGICLTLVSSSTSGSFNQLIVIAHSVGHGEFLCAWVLLGSGTGPTSEIFGRVVFL